MFCHCFTWDHWPTKFLIVRISANHNPELRCVICIGVTRFAPVLHLNCTALSQSESSNFFMCIINRKQSFYRGGIGVFVFVNWSQL